ncbi:MAG: hypothetical protein ABJC98_17295 [Bacteroidota bacterium]
MKYSNLIPMEQASTEEIFAVEYKGKKYPCKPVVKPQGVFYAIKFDTRVLVITKFVSGDQLFWTAIPVDSKINHIVNELGIQIDNHYKNK